MPPKTKKHKASPKSTKAKSLKIKKSSFGDFELSSASKTSVGKKIKGKLTLKDLNLQVEIQGKTIAGAKKGNVLMELDKLVLGPRPDQGAGDASAWTHGNISLAEKNKDREI